MNKPKLDLNSAQSNAVYKLATWLSENCPLSEIGLPVSRPECMPTARRILARANWDESRANKVAARLVRWAKE